MIDEQTWRKSTCTPHISKLGWEYLEINEITFLQPREENSNDVVGEVISILLRNKLRTREMTLVLGRIRSFAWNVWLRRLNGSR